MTIAWTRLEQGNAMSAEGFAPYANLQNLYSLPIEPIDGISEACLIQFFVG